MMSEAALARQRRYRVRTGNIATKSYEKTRRGKLMRTYRNMQSRVLGIQAKKTHLYAGLDILGREEFYSWSLSDEAFTLIYDAWVSSGYDRKMSPSIDRIDTAQGYVMGNMRWITHSENSRLGSIGRLRS